MTIKTGKSFPISHYQRIKNPRQQNNETKESKTQTKNMEKADKTHNKELKTCISILLHFRNQTQQYLILTNLKKRMQLLQSYPITVI